MAIDKSFWNNFKSSSNLISAHRGNRSICPENTMCAFENSLNKCDFIELDIGFTKDNIAVVIHDYTLTRTSNYNEFKKTNSLNKVIDYNYEQLLEFDFSSWFIRDDPFNTIKNNITNINELKKLNVQRILTLEEVLHFSKTNNFPINIEIKDMKDTVIHKNVSKIITSSIKKFDINHLILLSSFNHDYIKELNILLPNISKAALQEKNHPKNLLKYLNDLEVSAYNCDVNIINEDIIKILYKNDIKINIFTVNDKKEQNRLFKLGVNTIFTDFV